MTTEPMRSNGTPLSDEQTKAVEAGLAMHLRIKGELDEAHREIAELRQHLAQNIVEMEALRSFNNLLESRVEGCVADRDLAVKERAQLESLFAMIFAAMREFKIPQVKISEALHAHRTDPA
jgi:predicted nuclease with TOPRIM domain